MIIKLTSYVVSRERSFPAAGKGQPHLRMEYLLRPGESNTTCADINLSVSIGFFVFLRFHFTSYDTDGTSRTDAETFPSPSPSGKGRKRGKRAVPVDRANLQFSFSLGPIRGP